MNRYFGQIANLFIKLTLLLIVYTFCRILFLIVNFQTFSFNTPFELLNVFFYGVRFDYSSIIQYNLLFIVLYLLPFEFVNRKLYKTTMLVLFCVLNFSLLLFNLGDSEYFKYTAKRTTFDIFNYLMISEDMKVLLPQFALDFWYILCIWVVLMFALVYAFKYEPFDQTNLWNATRKYKKSFGILIFILFLVVPTVLFVGARGLGYKPLRIISTVRFVPLPNVPLLINTPFSILHTIQGDRVDSVVFFSQKEVKKIYTPEQISTSNKTPKNCNVVIIILESFSKEFVGSLNNSEGYTPHLDSIIQQGLVFENAFANGKRSIEAMPAVFAGLPTYTNDAYIASRFSGNKLKGLPSILNENGYNTSFFHGGRNGTMGFDDFAKAAGFQKYYGMKEYVGEDAYDGKWGISDEEFLHFFAKTINTFPQPFMSSVFTLSSHHPFTIPKKHENDYKKVSEPFIRSLSYADDALGKFFAEVSKMPWYENTLFVLVADHTGKEYTRKYSNRVGMFRIPIVFFHPGDTSLKGVNKRIAQQTDIMPTIINYLHLKQSYVAFGKDLFDPTTPSYASNFLNGNFLYLDDDFVLIFDGEKSLACYNFVNDPFLKTNVLTDSVQHSTKMELKLKAMIQQYNSRLIKNKMVFGNE